MTMKITNISEAKAARCFSIDDCNKFQEFQKDARRPTVSELFDKLREINLEEDDLEVPARHDRPLPNSVVVGFRC